MKGSLPLLQGDSMLWMKSSRMWRRRSSSSWDGISCSWCLTSSLFHSHCGSTSFAPFLPPSMASLSDGWEHSYWQFVLHGRGEAFGRQPATPGDDVRLQGAHGSDLPIHRFTRSPDGGSPPDCGDWLGGGDPWCGWESCKVEKALCQILQAIPCDQASQAVGWRSWDPRQMLKCQLHHACCGHPLGRVRWLRSQLHHSHELWHGLYLCTTLLWEPGVPVPYLPKSQRGCLAGEELTTIYYNHFLNERPFYVRAIGIMRAAYMLGFLIPFNINTMSIFSFSLDLCIKGEFFHAHYQMDDIIYTLTCMQALQKRVEILMIPMPVISGPTSGTSQWEEFSEWFRQSERWTIGACEVFHYFVVKRRRYNCSAALSYGTWFVIYYGFILCSLTLTGLAGFINYALINAKHDTIDRMGQMTGQLPLDDAANTGVMIAGFFSLAWTYLVFLIFFTLTVKGANSFTTWRWSRRVLRIPAFARTSKTGFWCGPVWLCIPWSATGLSWKWLSMARRCAAMILPARKASRLGKAWHPSSPPCSSLLLPSSSSRPESTWAGESRWEQERTAQSRWEQVRTFLKRCLSDGT